MWGQPPSAVRRAKPTFVALVCATTLILSCCSPRDFLSRRLATDLIAASDIFSAPQQFVLRTGVLSNKDFGSPEYLVLQHQGWISSTTVPCSPGIAPAPCWDVLLTPLGVDTVRSIVSADDATKPSISIPVAKRELVAVTGVSRQGAVADVEFTWKWAPLNEVGGALYSGDIHYKSMVGFREYDDGWRLLQIPARTPQTMDEALKNAEPTS
jgi:hypothetical protein